MDILSDVNIVGKVKIVGKLCGDSAVFGGSVFVDDFYSSNHIHTMCGHFERDVAIDGRLTLGSSLTKTISVPAQCTRFLLDSYNLAGHEGEEESNNKYPLVTAYRGGKKVDMDVEMSYERSNSCYYIENVIGNITPCSSDMTLRVSMLV